METSPPFERGCSFLASPVALAPGECCLPALTRPGSPESSSLSWTAALWEDLAVDALLLAIDQGTTSSRALVYDATGRCRGTAAREIHQHYPRPGWVEHDAEE